MEWTPKTKLGKLVKEGKIKHIDEILRMKKPILEPEIVDLLLPGIKAEIIEARSTQRVTDSGRKTSYRVLAVVGHSDGYFGYGIGKSEEFSIAKSKAISNAKKKLIKIKKGCGSWECRCNMNHSLPRKVFGKNSSVYIELTPGPRGLGLVANKNLKTILQLIGIRDLWTTSRGSVSNKPSLIAALYNALIKLDPFQEVVKI